MNKTGRTYRENIQCLTAAMGLFVQVIARKFMVAKESEQEEQEVGIKSERQRGDKLCHIWEPSQ